MTNIHNVSSPIHTTAFYKDYSEQFIYYDNNNKEVKNVNLVRLLSNNYTLYEFLKSEYKYIEDVYEKTISRIFLVVIVKK